MRSRILETDQVGSSEARQSWGASRTALNGPTPKVLIDKFAIVPISACVFALIVSPLLSFYISIGSNRLEGRPEPRVFWPVMAAISTILAIQNRSRLILPPNIIWLFAYLAFAGASVLWAFSPDRSFVRYLQQVMVVASIVLPALLADRRADLIRGLFLCFAFALTINLFFVFTRPPEIALYGTTLVKIGYQGYFGTKNPLGECAAAAFLLSLYELSQRGWRRGLGAVVIVIAIFLVFKSDSKTAFGLVLVCPVLAWLTLLARRVTRISPATILLTIPLCYALLSIVSHSSVLERISYILYHDSSLTGRTTIWDFAKSQIGLSPFIGWGYQSFWLVPDSPSNAAPGWVKMMPNAHNGYYDTMLETGYVGFVLLLVFIMSTLHAVGRVVDRDPARGWILLSFTLFMILYNFFESLWMRGFEFLWVTFLIVVAEIARYWRPVPLRRAASGSRRQRPGSPGPSPRFETAARDGQGPASKRPTVR